MYILQKEKSKYSVLILIWKLIPVSYTHLFPTLNGKGRKTNMVTWADSPEGPWSTPIDLKIEGIDPEHVVSEDRKRYLLLSSGALYPLSDDGCSIPGEPVRIYKEWEIPEEWDIEGVSMEGLNVKKVGEYYYCLLYTSRCV